MRGGPSVGSATRPDVLVVGAGPAGSTTGGLLADRGWHVLIVDRHGFPRPKPCGECLNPGAVAALDRLDLLDAVHALGPARIRGWDIETGRGHRASGRFGPDVGPGLALPRADLDGALLRRARERGARVEEGVRVTGVEPGRPGRGPRVHARASDRSPRSYAPSLVVGADGLRSVVARSVGGIRRKPELRKASLTFRVGGDGLPGDRGRLHLSDRGTVGLAPVGQGVWNVTVVAPAEHAPQVLGGPAPGVLARALDRAAPDWRGPAELQAGPWGSGPFDWPSRPLPAPGVVLVGDAAGYFDPLTGQGIYRALRSAELAADAIDRTLRGSRESGASPVPGGRRMRHAFDAGRRVQKVVEAVVSSPRLREIALRRLASAPAVLDALIRVTGDARPVRSLAAPAVLAHLVVPGSATRSSVSEAKGPT